MGQDFGFMDILGTGGKLLGGAGQFVTGLGGLDIAQSQAQQQAAWLEFARMEAEKQDVWIRNYAKTIGPINLQNYKWAGDVLSEIYGPAGTDLSKWGYQEKEKDWTKNIAEPYKATTPWGRMVERGLRTEPTPQVSSEKDMAERQASMAKTAGRIGQVVSNVQQAGAKDVGLATNRLREALATRGISKESGAAAAAESDLQTSLTSDINAQAENVKQNYIAALSQRADTIISNALNDPGLLYPSAMAGGTTYRSVSASDPYNVSSQGTGSAAFKPMAGGSRYVTDTATGKRYANVLDPYWYEKSQSNSSIYPTNESYQYFGYTGPTDPSYLSATGRAKQTNKLRSQYGY